MYVLLILSNTYENYYIQIILLKNNCNCHFVTEQLQERVSVSESPYWPLGEMQVYVFYIQSVVWCWKT